MSGAKKVQGQWISSSELSRLNTKKFKSIEQVQQQQNNRFLNKLPVKTVIAQDFNISNWFDKKTGQLNKSNYNIVSNPDGTTSIKAKPVTYRKFFKRTYKDNKKDIINSSYVPHEIKFNKQGQLVSEIRRKDYESYDRISDKYKKAERKVFDNIIKSYKPDGTLQTKKEYSSFKRRDYEKGPQNRKVTKGVFLAKDYDYSKQTVKTKIEPRTKTLKKPKTSATDFEIITLTGKTYRSPNKEWLIERFKEDLPKTETGTETNTKYASLNSGKDTTIKKVESPFDVDRYALNKNTGEIIDKFTQQSILESTKPYPTAKAFKEKPIPKNLINEYIPPKIDWYDVSAQLERLNRNLINSKFYDSSKGTFSGQVKRTAAGIGSYLLGGAAGLADVPAGVYYMGKTAVWDLPKWMLKFDTQGERLKTLKEIPPKLQESYFQIRKKIQEVAKTNPEYGLGYLTTTFYGPEAYAKTGKQAVKGYKTIGAVEISKDELFNKGVLKGTQEFPTTPNQKEALKSFKAAKAKNTISQLGVDPDSLIGTHATSRKQNINLLKQKQKLTAKEQAVIAGDKAIKGMEDAGLYFTPQGEGSPFFLKIPKDPEIKFSLNPFKNVQLNPSLIQLIYKDVSRLPKDILKKATSISKTQNNKKAFEFINEWYKKNKKPGQAYIPLRSELGHTPELQALLPTGTRLDRVTRKKLLDRLRGYGEYVKVNDKIVPIRYFDVKGKPSKITKKKFKDVDLKEISTPKYDYTKYAEKPVEYVTPYKYTSKVPYRTYKRSYDKDYKTTRYQKYSPKRQYSYKPRFQYQYSLPVKRFQPYQTYPKYTPYYGTEPRYTRYTTPKYVTTIPKEYSSKQIAKDAKRTDDKEIKEYLKKKRFKYKTRLSRVQDPFFRITGKKKYKFDINKLLRDRYGNIYV